MKDSFWQLSHHRLYDCLLVLKSIRSPWFDEKKAYKISNWTTNNMNTCFFMARLVMWCRFWSLTVFDFFGEHLLTLDSSMYFSTFFDTFSASSWVLDSSKFIVGISTTDFCDTLFTLLFGEMGYVTRGFLFCTSGLFDTLLLIAWDFLDENDWVS